MPFAWVSLGINVEIEDGQSFDPGSFVITGPDGVIIQDVMVEDWGIEE